MIFAKVDVKLRDHERAHQAGPAMATWTWGLLYARDQETDGFVPALALRGAWVGEKVALQQAKRLVQVGLWMVDDERDGWRICRYDQKNDTKAAIEQRRQETRERVARFREARNASVTRYTDAGNGVSNGVVPGSGSPSGSGSDSSSGRDPEPDRSPTPIRWQVGTAGSQRARNVFEDAVTVATGGTFALSTAPFHDRDLCLVLNKHGPKGLPPETVLAWLGDTVQAWVDATAETEERKPGRLNDWLNAKRPNRRVGPPARGAEITKQPFDPDAPWMKLETGS